MRRLPPLTALRVFEAVGRAGNVRAAAIELNVTPAAVSHQIRLLEEHVGADLFNRGSRGLVLTQAGAQFYQHVSEAFDRLVDAVRKIPGSHAQTVRVHSLPSFASCWLVPRLAKFYADYPGIDVEISTVGDLGQPLDLTNLGVDLAIRVGINENQWSGLHAEKLVHELMFPVCAPQLLQGKHPLLAPSDMANHVLLQVSRRAEGWPEWIAAAKAKGLTCFALDPDHGPKFDTIQMAITAAVEGMGVVMGRLPLIEDFLESGALVEPYSLRVESRNAYWLLWPGGVPMTEAAQKFRAWMRDELNLKTEAAT